MQGRYLSFWLHGDHHVGGWDTSFTQLTHGQRAVLAWVLVPALLAMATVFYARHALAVIDRARLSEVALMLGHARNDLTLERALRPAAQSTLVGDLETLGLNREDSGVARVLSLRYDRQGDRLLAHFSKNGDTGLWMLEPVAHEDTDAWVQNWRCVARSSGRLGAIAQHFCRGQRAPDAP